MSDEDVFAAEGITFSRIHGDKMEEVMQFLSANLFTDEPISRSLKMTRNWLVDLHFSDCIIPGNSVMATDSSGKIIGVRCAEVYERNKWGKWFYEKCFIPILVKIVWIFSSQLDRILTTFVKLYEHFEYDPFALMKANNLDKMFVAICLCTDKSSRRRGLGTELVRQSEEVGREEGCVMTCVIATGIYSQKIFRRMGYAIKSEIKYEDFKDKNNELYLKDTREHTSCQYITKKLL